MIIEGADINWSDGVDRVFRPMRFRRPGDDPDPLERLIYRESHWERWSTPHDEELYVTEFRGVARVIDKYIGLGIYGWTSAPDRVPGPDPVEFCVGAVIPLSIDRFLIDDGPVRAIEMSDVRTMIAVRGSWSERHVHGYEKTVLGACMRLRDDLNRILFGEIHRGMAENADALYPERFKSSGPRRANLYRQAMEAEAYHHAFEFDPEPSDA
ncbi:MAG: hypothetical protein ABEN55_00460 [Bradymonadaceae bacterium]